MAHARSDIMGLKARPKRTVGIRPNGATRPILPNGNLLYGKWTVDSVLGQLDLFTQPLENIGSWFTSYQLVTSL